MTRKIGIAETRGISSSQIPMRLKHGRQVLDDQAGVVGLVGIRRPVRVTGLFYKKPTKAQVYPRSDRNTVKEVRIERRRRPHDSLRQSSTKRGPVEEQKLGDPTILHGLLI